jgi:hypothetical protein
MADLPVAVRILLLTLAITAVLLALVALVRRAKGGKGFPAVGAALMLFGWMSLRDPGSNPVAEAKDGRARKGNESGDPPD